ncbi:CPCC family cysteine-rich protein [Niallia taxi]|uniref:CPCC family cysteine-rich protein n=1 Tax=Niallia taxi TaxID=2499688 RepID=UPI002E1E11B9|nr:CPCC family cysteine-rich protein [Niallia taxi]
MKKFTCPCCGYKTLNERDNWETCQVCKWMDDEIQSYEPDIGGANKVTLREAQKNFKEIGRADRINYHSKGEPTSKYEKDDNGKPYEER